MPPHCYGIETASAVRHQLHPVKKLFIGVDRDIGAFGLISHINLPHKFILGQDDIGIPDVPLQDAE